MFGLRKLSEICIVIIFLCVFSSSITSAVEIKEFDSLPVVGKIGMGRVERKFCIKKSTVFVVGDGLTIIDIGQLDKPKKIASLSVGNDYAFDIVVSGTLACIVDAHNGLLFVDVSKENSPELLSKYSIPSNKELLDYDHNDEKIITIGEDGYLYIAWCAKREISGNGKLEIIDLSSIPPKVVGSIEIGRYPRRITVSKSKAYIQDVDSGWNINPKGLQIIDISDPTSPNMLASNIGNTQIIDMQIVSDTIYLLDIHGSIYKIDGKSSSFPEIELFSGLGEEGNQMHIWDNSIYVSGEYGMYSMGLGEIDLNSGKMVNFFEGWSIKEGYHNQGNFIVSDGILYVAFASDVYKKGKYIDTYYKFKIVDLAGKTVINSIDKKKGFYGDDLEISGKGFTDNEGKVIIKGKKKKKKLEIVSWQNDEITGKIPWGINPGKVKIYIKKYNKVKSKNKKSFLYRKVRPKIQDAVFRADAKGGTDEIVLSGSNFGPKQSKNERIIVKNASVAVNSWENDNITLALDKYENAKIKLRVKTRYGKSKRKIIDLTGN